MEMQEEYWQSCKDNTLSLGSTLSHVTHLCEGPPKTLQASWPIRIPYPNQTLPLWVISWNQIFITNCWRFSQICDLSLRCAPTSRCVRICPQMILSTRRSWICVQSWAYDIVPLFNSWEPTGSPLLASLTLTSLQIHHVSLQKQLCRWQFNLIRLVWFPSDWSKYQWIWKCRFSDYVQSILLQKKNIFKVFVRKVYHRTKQRESFDILLSVFSRSSLLFHITFFCSISNIDYLQVTLTTMW